MLELAKSVETRRQLHARPALQLQISRAALIGNFPPRRCGIATFTSDLYDALTLHARMTCDVYAVTDEAAGYKYPDTVKFSIRENEGADYLEAAHRINASSAEIVIVQHEYGIYGGKAGERLTQLLDALRKPIVTTLHTVLTQPNFDQRRVLEKIIARSSKLVVMSRKGQELLQSVHRASPSKIVVIPHGAPDRALVDPAEFKPSLGLRGRDVIFTFGLLSPGKGIEAVIRALPAVKAAHSNALYVVLGATHPRMLEREGEAYRESLQSLAEELDVADCVRLINEYADTEKLIDYIGAADIYVTPYLNENQVTSGTLTYAVALGKPVISTPYWHAKELLDHDRGILVPFNDPGAIANATCSLLKNPDYRNRLRRNAYAIGREMTWARVGERYTDVLAAEKQSPIIVRRVRHDASLSEMTYRSIEAMTDSCGILQHSVFCVPDRSHGYCLDDNARALILMNNMDAAGLRAHRTDRLALVYASFIQHAWNEDQKCFRNFMCFDRRWLEERGSDDSFGRALWALGSTLDASSNDRVKVWALSFLERTLPHAQRFTHLRSRAFAILASCYLLRYSHGHELAQATLAQHAVYLRDLFVSRSKGASLWFEDKLTYDNARLPEALIRAGMALSDGSLLGAGLDALRWLCKI